MDKKVDKLLYISFAAVCFIIGIAIGNISGGKSESSEKNNKIEFYAEIHNECLIVHCDKNCKNARKGLFYIDPNDMYDDGRYNSSFRLCPLCINEKMRNDIKNGKFYKPKN